MVDSFQITITRQARRTISMHVLPDGTVEVKAPFLMTRWEINRFIEKNREWIEKRQMKLQKRPQMKKHEYVDGEQFYYLGTLHTLTIGEYKEIAFKEGILEFPKFLSFRIQKELTAWYMKNAEMVIHERLVVNAKQLDVSYKSVEFADTKSKWGHCTHENNLQFNWRLIMAPMIVINYVTVHELAHTVQKNHSADFWRLVRSINPSYKQQVKWLKDYGDLLFV